MPLLWDTHYERSKDTLLSLYTCDNCTSDLRAPTYLLKTRLVRQVRYGTVDCQDQAHVTVKSVSKAQTFRGRQKSSTIYFITIILYLICQNSLWGSSVQSSTRASAHHLNSSRHAASTTSKHSSSKGTIAYQPPWRRRPYSLSSSSSRRPCSWRRSP